jgi:hypothetical protein
MKRISIVGTLIMSATLLVATTRAMASPMAPTGNPHNTGTPEVNPGGANTPGAHATEQAGKHGLHGKPEILRGTIASVDAASLALTVADGSTVTVALTADTKIHVPGPRSAGDTLVTGMRAVVMALTDPNTNGLVARMVVAIPGQPVRAHRVGTVTAYTAGSSITIQAKDGASYTFGLLPDTKILPEDRAGSLAVGSLVTVIAPRVPSSLDWTARGIVVHPAGQ